MKKDGDCFRYIGNKIPSISDAKLKAGIFSGPQIRKLLNDDVTYGYYQLNKIKIKK